MLANKDLIAISRMVAATHGWPAAKAFKAFTWTPETHGTIARCAADLAKVKAAQGETYTFATALALQLQRQMQAPLQFIAGTLEVAGDAIGDFRLDSGPNDMRHLWIMTGTTVIDAAIFPIARSSTCPPCAARHIDINLGLDKAVYVSTLRDARGIGLKYAAEQVLATAEVDTLVARAYRVMARP